MENNKVVTSDGITLMDITDTTASPSDVAAGEVFYDQAGVRQTGTGNYMNKVSNPTAGNVLTTDANGQAQDSGVAVDDLDDVFVATRNVTTYAELLAAYNDRKCVLFRLTNAAKKTQIATVDVGTDVINLYLVSSARELAKWELDSNNVWTKTVTVSLVGRDDLATDTAAGVVKLNPAESVDVNADGQLTVGGRLGQYTDGGVFYPATIEPTGVGASSFLMTDGAKGLNIGSREFAIMAGAGLTIKSAAAGSTQYRATNSQANRIICAAAKNGFCAIDQTDAATNGTAHITDISFANGDPISFYFGENESNNDIIITVDKTVNPNSATTKLRMYGNSTSNDVIAVGQGVGATNGKAIVLGQSCFGGGNQIIALGNGVHVMANNSSGFGHTHLVNKQYCFAAGQGHDFTNASNGASAFGTWSILNSDTAFAVGNGNANVRSNAFEVTADGGIIVPSSTSGSTKKFKITVDDSGTISATEV